MTTPAVNVNVLFSKEIHHVGTSNYSGGYNFNLPISIPVHWEERSRPASSTRTRNPETGWRDCGPWDHYGHKIDRSGGTNGYRRRWTDGSIDDQYYTGGGLWNYSPYVAPPFPSNLENKCLVKALNKVKDQDVNLGTYFVEGKDTIRMVSSRTRQIASSIMRFRRRFPDLWEKVKSTQRGGLPCHLWHLIPGAWLEVQLGWDPLLKDIMGAVKHLEKSAKTVGQLVKVSSRNDEEDLITRVIDARAWALTARTEVRIKHAASVSLWFELNNPDLAELSSLGLINPVEWAWEAVPYSFVLDWLVPIGGWLSSLTADVGWSFKGGSCSLLTKWKERGLDNTKLSGSLGTQTYETYGGPPIVKTEDCFRFKRKCYSSVPVPGLYYKNPLSASHITTGLALLATSLFGSGSRRS